MDSKTRELLKFYDELTALHACNAFVLQALAMALAHGDGLDERSATGAMFCAQWLDDRMAGLEEKLNKLVSQANAAKEMAED